MSFETTRRRGRPSNRRQYGVREDGIIVGGVERKEKLYYIGMEEAPEKGKEFPHSAHVNGTE
jgi:hypothetical protein